jgi:SSS family solute:Na+ symporter
VSFFFLLAFGLAVAPHTLNNVLAAKKNSYYKWAPLAAFIAYIIAFYMIKFAGFAANSMALDGVLTVLKADYAIIAATEYSLSSTMWSFFAVLILSAVMSTTDRLLLTIGTLFSWDVYKPLLNPNMPDQSIQKISRLAILVASVFAFILAIKPPELLAFLIWMGIGLMLATYCVPLLAGLYWKRATRQGAIASMVVGLITAVVAGYIHQYVYILPVHFSFVAFIASAITMVVVSLLTPKPSEEIIKETATGISI